MNKLHKITTLLIGSLLFTSLALSQNNYQTKSLHFQYLTVEDGLSQGSVYSIFQDNRGFLWFATQYGLNRYDGYTFKYYVNNPSDSLSLSSNYVHSIAQDKAGNLWVATEDGLNRYNYITETFTRYLYDSEIGQNILSVMVDNNGIVWAGTASGGLYRLEIGSGKSDFVTITNYRHKPGDIYSLSSNLARRIFEDTNGNIWIGTDKGLNLLTDYKKGIFKRIISVNTESGIVESQIWTIFESNTGRLFIGSTAGLFSVYKDIDNSYSLIDLSTRDNFTPIFNSVISSCLDNSGNLWIGRYQGGLFLWDEKNSKLAQILDSKKGNDLSARTIYSIFVDRSDVVWIGTDNGLLKWTASYSYFDSYINGNEGKENGGADLILAFYEDHKGKIWIGTDLGLEIFNPASKTVEQFDLENYIEHSHNDNNVKSLYQDGEGNYWIGTSWKGLFEMTPGNNQNKNYKFSQYWFKTSNNPDVYDNSVLKIVEDKWGYLWLATKYGIKRFNKTSKEFSDLKFTPQSKIKPPRGLVFEIFKSLSDPDIYWIGTRNDGLYQILLGKDENEITGLKHFIHETNDSSSLNSSFVRTILEDKIGKLWVGTISGGLNLLNPDSSTFSHFDVRNNLPSDVITGILQDDFGYLWLSTFSGLSRFDPSTSEVINFSKSDGLRNIEFNGGAYLKISSGELLFGGTNGFDIVYPELIEKNKKPPPVVITDIRLYNKSIINRIQKNINTDAQRQVTDYGIIELSYNENVISFEFSALDYVNPAYNKYACTMEGIDTSWYFIGTRRFANYTRIPPGKYLFRVKAANNNGVWNNYGASVIILIAPPFWQTWWFRTLIIISILALLAFLYKYRINKIEEKKRLLELQVREKTEAAQKIQDALSEVEMLKNQLQAENIYLQDEIKLTHNFENIISTSDSFKKILYQVEQVSGTEATVLILGESGTGKELIARAIHSLSNRKNKPLIKVNCAALPATLIESELFGHEKGAFTGAFARKIGRFEIANGGTMFLDEVGELPFELQTKLLRVLQEGEFERVGGTISIKVNVRVIAATNRDLEEALKQGSFREDLYYRLNVFPISIPPLRNRKEDIPVLVNYFVNKHSKKVGKKMETISPADMKKLIEYEWPGNVRELENVIERAIIVSKENKFRIEGSFLKAKENGKVEGFQPLQNIERKYIIEVLESTNWRVSGPKGAAKILGLLPSTLEYRMKKLNIQRK